MAVAMPAASSISGAHQRRPKIKTAEPRISQQDLSRRKQQRLTGKVHRHVSWLHVDVNGLEMNPHCWSWVAQASMRKSIRTQQKAEIIRYKRKRDRKPRQNCDTQRQGGQANRPKPQGAAFRDSPRKARSIRENQGQTVEAKRRMLRQRSLSGSLPETSGKDFRPEVTLES